MEVSEKTNDRRSFGSNIQPSSQSRKMSIGLMADCAANTRNGAMKGERAIMPNTKKVVSNGGNFVGEERKVDGVRASFNMKQIGLPEEAKCSRTTKSVFQIGTDGIECAPQLFSNQTTNSHPSSNQKKLNATVYKRKGKKDEIPERIENFTFKTSQEVFESDKTKLENKRNMTENRTENLRMKLCQILGTTSSPKTHHSGSQTCNMDEERLPPEQRSDQKDDKFNNIKQSHDTIETDHTNGRPVTRSWNRKRSSAKMQPLKCKSDSRDKGKHQAKNILSFDERRTGRRSCPDDDPSMSLRDKSHRRNFIGGPRKICFPENDEAGKLRQKTVETDITPPDEGRFSLGNKTGGSRCLYDHQKESLQTQKIIQEQESHQSPIIKKGDQHRELEDSENGNQRKDIDTVTENVAGPQISFQSPTFGHETPTLSSTPSSTPKKDQKVSIVSSPESTDTERRFHPGTIHNLRISKIFDLGNNEERTPKQSSDIEELKDSLPRKVASLEGKGTPDGRSDSSSEERNFQGSQEGSRGRHIAEKPTVMLNPIKKLRRNEGIKFSNNNPASSSSKGTRGNNWAHEVSEQNQEDGFVRVIELLASELGKVSSKLKSVTSQKSSEILMSAAEEIHLQLQNVHSQIQTDIGKLTNLSKSKRRRLETSFEGHQKQLRLIHEKFKEEVNLHLKDCRGTVESLEADQMEIKGVLEKQRVSQRKLLSQAEEAVEIQLNDAQRKITAIQELGKEKLLQLKYVIAMFLKEGMLN